MSFHLAYRTEKTSDSRVFIRNKVGDNKSRQRVRKDNKEKLKSKYTIINIKFVNVSTFIPNS